jgi:recombination associated protein RdgC
MGLLSSRISLTRYKVVGQLEGAVNETVYQQLKKNMIPRIETDGAESMIGWTSFEKPYEPGFEGYSFVFGAYLVFSMRIDKKTIPPKLVAKHYALALAKRLSDSGLEYLPGAEKKALKEHVVNSLSRRIPATPNVYDLVWNYNDASLWCFSNLKSANEALETLFIKTFGLQLIRLFPYTNAELTADLSDDERDLLRKLSSDNTK